MAIKGYWKLDGNANDYSGKGLNMTNVDTIFSQGSGKIGSGGLFNGSTSKLYTSSLPMITTGDFTMAAWFKISNSFGGQIFHIGRDNGTTDGNGYGMCIADPYDRGAKRFCAVWSGVNWIETNMVPTIGVWYRFVIQRKSGYGYIYINGVQAPLRASVSGTPKMPTEITTIGCQSYTGVSNMHFYGSIDGVCAEDNAWSIAKIKNDYLKDIGFF
jgi:hypothetical protein